MPYAKPQEGLSLPIPPWARKNEALTNGLVLMARQIKHNMPQPYTLRILQSYSGDLSPVVKVPSLCCTL